MIKTNEVVNRIKLVCNAIKTGIIIPRKNLVDTFTIYNCQRGSRSHTEGITKIKFNLIDMTISMQLKTSWYTITIIKIKYLPSEQKIIIIEYNPTDNVNYLDIFQKIIVEELGDLLYTHSVTQFIKDPNWKGCLIDSLLHLNLSSLCVTFNGFLYLDNHTYDYNTYEKVIGEFYKTHTHVHWQKAVSQLYDNINTLCHHKRFTPKLVKYITNYIESKYTKPKYWDYIHITPEIENEHPIIDLTSKDIQKKLKSYMITTERFYLFDLQHNIAPNAINFKQSKINEWTKIIETDLDCKFALCKCVKQIIPNIIVKKTWYAWDGSLKSQWEKLEIAINNDPLYHKLRFMNFDNI